MNPVKCPVLLTLTGPSAGGKSTVQKRLLDSGDYASLISFTSRPPRDQEVHGKDYYFYTREEIAAMEDAGEIAEIVEIVGQQYGLTTQEFDRVWSQNKIPTVVVEPDSGLGQLEVIAAAKGWKIVRSFITAPANVLVERQLERLVQDAKAGKLLNEKYINYAAERITNTLMHELTVWRQHDYEYVFENNIGEASIDNICRVLKAAVNLVDVSKPTVTRGSKKLISRP